MRKFSLDLDRTSDWMVYDCPNCGNELPLHTAVNPESEGVVDPHTGDVGICWVCQELIVYTGLPGERATGVKVPTDQELAKLMADPEVAFAVNYTKKALAGFQEWKKRRGL